MGLFDKLLGREPDYPTLDDETPEAGALAAAAPQIESLAEDAGRRVEVIPADDATYIVLGHPSRAFGIAWVRGGELHNLKDVVEQQRVDPLRLQVVVEKVRDAYKASGDAPRFSASVRGHEVVVTRSPELGEAMSEAIDRLAA